MNRDVIGGSTLESELASFVVWPDPLLSIDAIACGFILAAGFGPDHNPSGLAQRAGHGIGLLFHEPIGLIRGDPSSLQSGMCFCNEPMTVISNEFRIRFEGHFYFIKPGAISISESRARIDQPCASWMAPNLSRS